MDDNDFSISHNSYDEIIENIINLIILITTDSETAKNCAAFCPQNAMLEHFVTAANQLGDAETRQIYTSAAMNLHREYANFQIQRSPSSLSSRSAEDKLPFNNNDDHNTQRMDFILSDLPSDTQHDNKE